MLFVAAPGTLVESWSAGTAPAPAPAGSASAASRARARAGWRRAIVTATGAQPVKFGCPVAPLAQWRKVRLATSRRPFLSTATTRILLRPVRRPATPILTEKRLAVVRLISLPSRKTLTRRSPTESWIRKVTLNA